LAYDIAAKKAQENPADDLARGNQARLLVSRGDLHLRTSGDARAARRLFRRAVALQEEIVAHPRSGYYTSQEARRLLQEYCGRLGGVSTLLGDAGTARRRYLQVLPIREGWVKASPQSAQARSLLAEAYHWLGAVSWRLQDTPAAHQYCGKAKALCRELVDQFPNSQSFKIDFAEVCGGYGEALCRLGRPARARPLFQQAVDTLEQLARQVSGSPDLQFALGRAHYQLAGALLHLGERQAAAEQYRQALRSLEPVKGGQPGLYLLALARCGRTADAVALAEQLRQRAPHHTEMQFQIARAYSICAETAHDPAQRKDYTRLAVKALQDATAGEYRDVFVLDTDPDLEAIRQDPAYRQLVTRLRPKDRRKK
jgi:tetratricopeptide (TPR) repeat protein